LLDQGFWLSGREGDTLTREEEAVTHLFYLSSGEARVMSHGKRVGTCHAGDLIGEVTVLSGDEASATVILEGPARFWCAPAKVLRPYLAAHDDVRHALEQGFTASLKAKLRASNERIAEAGGVAV
jgi:CRP-like cAMP-binding protein